MKILLAASEVAPIIKVGGLGDVAGSLPKALEKLGVNVDVIAPFYPFAKTENLKMYKSIEIQVPFNDEVHMVEVFNTKLPNSQVNVILLRNAYFFAAYGKQGGTAHVTDLEMFSFFDRAVVTYIESQFNTYDLVHCNDWHTGLLTHILQDELSSTRPATLFTVHNLMYQGIGDPDVLRRIGINPGEHPLIDWDIADGDVNFMQQGITSCDFVNTVSPTYAKEILTPDFGGGFTDILKSREARLTGILNGIDYSSFPRNYDVTNFSIEKPKLKAELIANMGLNGSQDKPIFAYIGRLDPYQKGLDILFEAMPSILESGGQFVLLADGDEDYKHKLAIRAQNPKYAGNIAVKFAFDTKLAELIYSGSDFLIVPSKYEPCGLIQLIAMWYGTLPIVRETGGLKDTVKNGHNGITFEEYSAPALVQAVKKAFSVYSGHMLKGMIVHALESDFSWDKSALEYRDLYTKVIQLRKESLS